MNKPTPTTSLDLPPALANILNYQRPAPAQSSIPSYEAGGMIGPGGMPEPIGMPNMRGAPAAPTGQPGLAPPGQQSGGMAPQMMGMQVNQFAAQNPEQVEQIRMAIMQVIQSGELTSEELNMVVQLATVASQNPEMYPYVRNFAIQQGIATEQDLPAQYDEGLVFVLLLAARAVQQDMGGAPEQEAAPQQGIPSMAKGGEVPQSKKSDGSVMIRAHEEEYVIPAQVVKMKGKEFFDNLVQKYNT